MYKSLFAVAAVTAASFFGAANAVTTTDTFDVVVVEDNLNIFTGLTIGTLDLTYDTDDIAGTGTLIAVPTFPFLPGFDFELTFTNPPVAAQTFADADDPDAYIDFNNGVIENFTISISEISTIFPIAINEPRIISFNTNPLGLSGDQLNLSVSTVVPLPAPVALLACGLFGLGAVARRKKV